MSIHQRIRERRLALGMASHKALAERVGVSWQTVQLWEKEGGTAPNRSRIEAVALALGVSTAWLLHGDQSDDARSNDPKSSPVDPIEYAWISGTEAHLLTLYRTTDERGKMEIIKTASEQRRIISPGIVRNKT